MKNGQRCPYCQSDLSKSIKWIVEHCPVMNRKQFILHVSSKHQVSPKVAAQVFDNRSPAWDEKV